MPPEDRSFYNDSEKSRLALEVVEKPNPGAYDLTIRKGGFRAPPEVVAAVRR